MVAWLFGLLALSSATILQSSTFPVDPIEIGITNQDMVNDYYFNFQAAIVYEKDSFIYIEFPSEYETVTVSAVNLVFNKGLISASTQDATFTLSSHLVTVTFPAEVSAGAQFSIHMEDVKNPQALTSTGSFKVYTRKVNDIRNSSENWAFDVLAFTSKWAGNVPGSSTLYTAGSGYVTTSATDSNYYFKILIDRDVDILTWFKITLPTGWSKNAGIDLNCGISPWDNNQNVPTGDFQCRTEGDVIYLEGLGQNIYTATNTDVLDFALYIPSISNPRYAVAIDAEEFIIDLVRPGTETVNYRYRCNTPAITALVPTFTWKVNGDYAYSVTGTEILGVFEFTNSQTIENGGKVQIAVDQSTYVSDATHGCYIISGPGDISTADPVTCSTSSNTLTLSNFPNLPEGSTTQVQVTFLVGTGTYDTFTLSTYNSDNAVVEQAAITGLTRQNVQAMTDVTVDMSAISASDTTQDIQVKFKLNTSLPANTGRVRIEFPTAITLSASNSVPTCQYFPNGGGWTAATACGWDPEFHSVEVQIGATSLATGVEHQVKIENFDYPNYSSNIADVYEVCLSTQESLNADIDDVFCQAGTLNPKALTTGTIVPDCLGNDIYSVYTFTIKPNAAHNAVSGVNPEVRIKLPTRDSTDAQNGFALDAGVTSGNIPCTSNIADTVATCTITNAASYATDQFVEIRITGITIFSISQDTVVNFVLKNPLKENLTYNASIELGYEINRVFRITEWAQTVGISTDTTAVTTASHPWSKNLCGKRNSAGDPTSPRQYYAINDTTDLTCRVESTAQNNAVGTTISWLFPVGWDLTTVGVAPSIFNPDGTAEPAPTGFLNMANDYAPMLRMIVGDAGATQVQNGSDNDFVFVGLINPEAEGVGTGDGLITTFASAAGVPYDYGTTTATLVDSTPGTISTYTITADVPERNALGVLYNIKFTTVNRIPADGQIVIVFATGYSLTNVEVTLVSANLKATDGIADPTVSVVSATRTITISGLNIISAAEEIEIQFNRVDNPGIAAPSDFVIRTSNSDGNNIDKLTNGTIALSTAYIQGEAHFAKIEMDPKSKGAEKADMNLQIFSAHKVPWGSNVQITLPSDFENMDNANCYVNYKTTLCSVSGLFINFTTGEDIAAEATITIDIYGNVKVPTVAETGFFSINISYQNEVIDATEAQVNNDEEKFRTEDAAQLMSIEEIDFEPSNEGEQANYRFRVIAPDTIAAGSVFIIWFPDNFDPSLNLREDASIDCWTNEPDYLGSQINCSVKPDRRVDFVGFKEINKNLTFDLLLSGIINPNYTRLSGFRFAIQDANGKTLFYTTESGSLTTGQSPYTLSYDEMSYTVNYARDFNDLTFTFTPSTDFPSDANNGKIFVDFPADFVLKNPNDTEGWSYPCSTELIESDVVSSTNWNDAISCRNYHSNRVEITGGKEFKASTTKQIRIVLQTVRGPQDATQTKAITISTYDGASKTILDRSYAQLGYPDTLELPLGGEDLIVNNNEPIMVNPGLMTLKIPVSVENVNRPMRTDLTLSVTMPRIPESAFSPSNVMLFRTSEAVMYFGLSVPRDTPAGIYYLEWSKSGDSQTTFAKDVPSVYNMYSNIRVSTVIVQAATASITHGDVGLVSETGHSHFIPFTLSIPPHIELNITPRTAGNIAGLVYSPSVLTFASGETEKDLMIYASSVGVDRFTVQFDLSGLDSGLYGAIPDMDVQIIGAVSQVPTLVGMTITTTRREADFVVLDPDTTGILYFQVELLYNDAPTSQEIFNNYALGKSLRLNVYDEISDITFGIDGLAAGTQYIAYMILADTEDDLSAVYSQEFQTLEDYVSLQFVIDFSQLYVPAGGAQNFIDDTLEIELAHAMSVVPERVQGLPIADFAQSRRLQGDADNIDIINPDNYSANAVVFTLANDRYSDQVSPTDLLAALTIAEYNDLLSKYDQIVASSISTPTTISNLPPRWLARGNLYDATENSITASGSLNIPGYLHILVLDSGSPAPESQQCVWGVDGDNNVGRQGSQYYNGEGGLGFVSYTGLDNTLAYDVYVCSSNAYPGNNKAVDDDVFSVQGVRIDSGVNCNPCDDTYLVVDDWGAVLCLAVWALL